MLDDFNTAKGFVFDCDGTLLDTLRAWEEAEAPLFAQTGPLTTAEEDEIHSAPIEKAAALFHEKHGVGESPDAVLAHLDGFLLPFYRDKANATPGAVDFVRMIAGRGIPCVVLSSSPRRYLEAGLRRAGILECFEDLVTTDEVGVSKQDFAIYDRALEILGSPKPQTWAVDDAPYAIDVMADYGLKTIGVAGVCSAERRMLLEKRADIVVETLQDITNL